ncbi:MAG: DUF4097 family beta strand repeat protein [Oscillospiraceae bacterium]|nr:DUF4097 family beta strand repeat protein [Oscillospiraceae bacterium]
MKTNAIIRIILFSLAIVVLLTILGVGIAARSFMFNIDSSFTQSGLTESSTGTADAATVRKLSIEWAAGTIIIRPADITTITLTETCSEDADPMVWLQSGDTLKVSSVKRESFLNFGSVPSKDLLIEVPRDWVCDGLEIETAAANLNAEYLTISNVDFDGASGVFRFTGCTVDAMDIDTASGNIYFDGSLNSIDCDAASADCKIVLTNCPDRIEMDMASGDLDLTLLESCGFTATLEALSGQLDTDFEITHTGKGFTSGDGACRIDVSAMSGDVYIHKLENLNCDH